MVLQGVKKTGRCPLSSFVISGNGMVQDMCLVAEFISPKIAKKCALFSSTGDYVLIQLLRALGFCAPFHIQRRTSSAALTHVRGMQLRGVVPINQTGGATETRERRQMSIQGTEEA